MFEEKIKEVGYDINKRTDDSEIQSEYSHFNNMKLLTVALDLTDTNVMIINYTRQIVFANNQLIKNMGLKDIREILGKRPGELVQCKYSDESPNGCGAGSACASCSALDIAMKSILYKIQVTGESSMPLKTAGNDTLNIHLSIMPYDSNLGTYYVISLYDMTDTIRKRELERIFFHDLLNTTGAIRGLLELIEDEVPTELINDIQVARTAFDNMIEEINFQKQLSDSENRKIERSEMTIFSLEFINIIIQLYAHHRVSIGKTITVSEKSENIPFISDFVLLKRVVENMVKNALEASNEGDEVIIESRVIDSGDKFRICVKNQALIPPNILPRIFYKNFSSKGKGRGLGTYSMKIIGETYLNGVVGFTSDEENGTSFYIDLPIKR